MFFFGEPKRSGTAAVAPKTNATLSLPSLWLRLTFSLHDRSTRPQINTLPKENFAAIPWTSASFENIEAAFV